jgi:hypothetical protein
LVRITLNKSAYNNQERRAFPVWKSEALRSLRPYSSRAKLRTFATPETAPERQSDKSTFISS